jgi:YidC/Oxa1 family membrane protein insertase
LNDFRQPEDGSQLRRTLLAFGLVLVLLLVMQLPIFRRWFATPEQPAPPPQQSQAQQPQPAPAAAPTPPAPAPAPGTRKKSRGTQTTPAPETRVATAEQQITVENDLYRVQLSNKGAQVISWVLKQYTDDHGRPLELVHSIAAQQYGYPLSLWTYDQNLRDQLKNTLYVVSSKDSGEGSDAQRAVSFEYMQGGVTVHKTLTFLLHPAGKPEGETYCVKIETSVMQNGAPVWAFPAWPAGFGDQTVPGSYAAAIDVWRYQDHVERIAGKSVSSGATLQQPMQWAGTSDQYFAAVFLPDQPQNAVMVTLHNLVKVPRNLDRPNPAETVEVSVLGAAVGDRNGATSERLFVGPKAVEVIDSVRAVPVANEKDGPDLEPLVDFGRIFGWLAKPLFLWLKWTHDHWLRFRQGWGWAIVVLTIIINAALLPLRITSMRSMMKMQKAQPQIKAIQEKYKKYGMRDPKRAEMQKEMSALYKREGVNPAGGCLPLLLQWPFLVAFYSMLGVAIELRHAPWVWIRDLASPDPFVLPILVALSMFVMQKMSPQTGGDPVQQKMMLFGMPLFIGWISHSMAAGLAVYWVWSNVVMMVQQYFMNRTAFGQEMRALAVKRATSKPRR